MRSAWASGLARIRAATLAWSSCARAVLQPAAARAVERAGQDVVVDGLQEGGVVLGGAQDHATPNWTTNPAWPWPVGAHSTWPAARATARRPMGGSGECLFTSL